MCSPSPVADACDSISMPSPEVSKKSLKKVGILNPIENGSDVTSRKRAMQFVEAQRAVFIDENFIRFIESDPRNQAASMRAAVGYNSVNRMSSRGEVANIPIVRPGKALMEALTKRSRVPFRRHVAGRSGPVRVIVSPQDMH
jgi:hypothetical protein